MMQRLLHAGSTLLELHYDQTAYETTEVYTLYHRKRHSSCQRVTKNVCYLSKPFTHVVPFLGLKPETKLFMYASTQI